MNLLKKVALVFRALKQSKRTGFYIIRNNKNTVVKRDVYARYNKVKKRITWTKDKRFASKFSLEATKETMSMLIEKDKLIGDYKRYIYSANPVITEIKTIKHDSN